ncbi:MAG: TraM recognition domain-containing protein [Anaeromyxobacteraceae bacterium]
MDDLHALLPTDRDAVKRAGLLLDRGARGLLALILGAYVRAPRAFWSWIWTRPWPLGTRLRAIVAPWALVGLLFAAPAAFVASCPPRGPPELIPRLVHRLAVGLVHAENFAITRLANAAQDAWEPPASDRALAARAYGRALVGVSALTGFFALNVIFGGPIWVPLLTWTGRHRAPRVLGGRPIQTPSLARFDRWRSKADDARTWFLGSSGTGNGPLMVGPAERLTHTWVVGATGTGKTQSVLLPLLRGDIRAGRTVVFIDGKGDRETLSALWHLAQDAGRERDFRFFDLRRPAASCTYSPLLNGTPNEQSDKIMDALRWDNEYYRSQSQAVLLRTLRALKATGRSYTLDDLVAALSDLGAFRALALLVPERQRLAELEPVATRWKDYQLETAGLRAQLDSLLMTDFGELLMAPQPTLDLAEAYRSRSIVYFALPVAKYRQTAPLLAKMIIGDLNSVSGMVQEGQLSRDMTSVVVDEFAAFAMPMFIDLMNKARSAGMAITISHQSMRGDLANAGEGYVGQVADNTNIKICLRQSEDAEYVAGLAGTRSIVRRTQQVQTTLLWEDPTGLGSAREADEYNVSPNLIRELPQGVAVVKIDQPERRLDVVRLDFMDTAGFAPYEPPVQVRAPGFGLDLRGLAVSNAPATPPAASPLAPRFDGA